MPTIADSNSVYVGPGAVPSSYTESGDGRGVNNGGTVSSWTRTSCLMEPAELAGLVSGK